MAVIRQLNLLGQMRLDVPHLRSLESSIAADFDLLAGNIMAGQKALVVRGFDIDTSGVGQPATTLKVNVAGSVLLHPLASEAGTIFAVDADAQPEALSPANSSVSGSFIAGQDNFIGIDLRRAADASTTDTVMFLDANTRLETPRSIPLARTLSYKIVVSTTDFAATPHVCPVAKVELDNYGRVSEIVDCRPMAFRLGAGGSLPDALHAYPWAQGRTPDSVDEFGRGDKSIGSEKDWRDAVMTRLWELGGGERWYSPTSDRDVKLCFGKTTFEDGKNFGWANNKLSWKGLSVAFANSSVSGNVIADDEQGRALNDGDCLYVDINRSSALLPLVPGVGPLSSLGAPTVPGSRFIIAWRRGNEVFARDYPIEVTRDLSKIPTHNGQNTALALFAGNEPGKLVWRQVEPFVSNSDAGYVVFDAGEGMSGDENFFWDNENKRLGIGTDEPSAPLHIKTGDGAVAGIVVEAAGADQTSDVPCITMVQGTERSFLGHNVSLADKAPDASSYVGAKGKALLVGTASNRLLQLGTNSKVALTVDANQYVGVGTSTPNALLQVSSKSLAAMATVKVGDSDETGVKTLQVENSSNKGRVFLDASGNLFLRSEQKNVYIDSVGPVENNVILCSTGGSVSVGTDEIKNTSLHVYKHQSNPDAGTPVINAESNKNPKILVSESGSGRPVTQLGTFGGHGFVGTMSNHPFGIGANNVDRITILPNGNVGVGVDDPQNKLEVAGDIRSGESVSAGHYVNVDGLANGGTRDLLYFGTESYFKWQIKLDKAGSNNHSNLQFWTDGVVNNQSQAEFRQMAYISGLNADYDGLNFTGQHRCPSEEFTVSEAKEMIGLICVSGGKYVNADGVIGTKNGITINESLPTIRLSSRPYQKSVLGVISGSEDSESESREYRLGAFVTCSQKSEDDNRIIINSIGEGAMWVCDANGPLENGDYVTSSEVPGHGMRQDDDLLHNYTVAKITMDCDFNPQNGEYEVVEFEHDGKKYKKAFVGCTYHCG